MPMFFSPNSAQISKIAQVGPARRRSTTISMIEEEFGMRESTQAAMRFRVGLPSRLRFLPPMRKRSPTQVPEPRRNSSLLKGSWETVWDCDAEETYLVESPPDEDMDAPSDAVLGYGEQESELDHSVATPTCDASWYGDGEATPLFSSNFPTQHDHPEGLKHEDNPDETLSRINTLHTIEPATL